MSKRGVRCPAKRAVRPPHVLTPPPPDPHRAAEVPADVDVDVEGEVEVDAFEVQFSPEKPLDQLDEDMLRALIEGAPYILPSEE